MWDVFKEYIQNGVEFLNNVIDKTTFPHESFRQTMLSARPIGLGFMGFADILIKLKITYGSEESIILFEDICKFLTKEAFRHSIHLAGTTEYKKKKLKIPNSDLIHFEKLLTKFVDNDVEILADYKKNGILNNQVSVIPPTGSISISADCSYAWEPLMAIVWEKPLKDRDVTLKFINQDFIRLMKEHNKEVSESLITKIIKNKGSIQNITEIPDDIKNICVCAHDIPWDTKVEMQSRGQQFITMAISSTCNLPNSATVEDIENAFIKAYKAGLKGITVYRDGSIAEQPVNFGSVEQTNKNNDNGNGKSNILTIPVKMKRPKRRRGETFEVETPYGKLYIRGNYDDNGRVFEIFLDLGKIGYFESSTLDTLSRVISNGLQHGVPLQSYIKTMINTKLEPFWFRYNEADEKPEKAESIFDCIAKVLDYMFLNSTETGANLNDDYNMCPNCGKRGLTHKYSSCRSGTCVYCNWSQCS